jgi:cellobiose phosphorylase
MNPDKYGYFDDLNKEYVINTPYTPTPWINYLGNDGFFGLISNTAGGYCFDQDPKFRRLLRYRYNSVPVDSSGRYFYLRNNNSIWSATGRPVENQPDEYECRHGLGYSKFIVKNVNVLSELTSFIPLAEKAEVHRLKITNQGDHPCTLSLFSYIEWCLWNAEDDGSNFQRNLSTGEVEVEGSMLFHKTEFRERRNHYGFYSVNHPISGFDTDRQSFLGDYRGVELPQAVQNNCASNSMAKGWSPIASHHLSITLAVGETKTLNFVLGYCELEEEEKWQAENIINKTPAIQIAERYASDDLVTQALNDLKDYWHALLAKFNVTTPDDKFNRSLNIWNQYQNMVTFNLSRSASFYESGIGRGMGFRDSNQDTIGFVHLVPEKVRERILDLAATQKSDGSAYHQYQPLTKKGNAAIGGNFNDDPMWLVLSTVNYIKETGDWSILDALVPFENTVEIQNTHFDHLLASFTHVINNLGPHNLPLIGRADWNDCLNLNCFSVDPNESFQTTQRGQSDTAESLMIAGQFVLYGKLFVDLCNALGKHQIANKCQMEIDKMVVSVEQHGWDGNWFLRAYNALGEKIGSNDNQEGKIFIESQGFCVMAGIGLQNGNAKLAMDSVKQHLVTDFGILLQQPAFSRYNKHLGEIFILSSRLQRKCRYFLPQQPLDFDCRGDARKSRPSP